MFVSAHLFSHMGESSLFFVHVVSSSWWKEKQAQEPWSPGDCLVWNGATLICPLIFRNDLSSFPSTLTTVKFKDFGVRKNLIYWWLQTLGKYLNLSESEFSCWWIRMIVLALPGVGIEIRILFSVQRSPQLAWRRPLLYQQSYQRICSLDTGDLPCPGSWILL